MTSSAPLPPSARLPWWRFAIAAVLAGCGLLALALDVPAAVWFREQPLPKELMRYLSFSEVFGHGLGVAVIMIGVFCLDRSLHVPALTWPAIRWPTYQTTAARRHAARMLGGLVAGPLTVLLLKQAIDRVRPRAADLAEAVSAVDTFGRTLLTAGPHGSSDLHSFPSGHSATAAALAAVLIWKYPQGRWFFLTLAVSACLQRLASSAHYPSDACFGAALGVLGAALVLGREPSPRTSSNSAAPPLATSPPETNP